MGQPVNDWNLSGTTQKGNVMKNKLWMLSIKAKNILECEEGQDLIEYALVVALIALAATAGMSSLATSINTAFTNIGTKLTGYTG